MAGDSILDSLEKLIAEVERDKDLLTSRLLELRNQVQSAVAEKPTGATISAESSETEMRKTHFDRIVEFLLSKENRPQSTKAIIRGTGIVRGALTQVFYRSHKAAFVSSAAEGAARKKLWKLSDEGLQQAGAAAHLRINLFGDAEGDLSGTDAADCCYRILRDHGNVPMNVLTMTREALRRGYRARTRGSEDEVLFSTAKSFWARLGRDTRFVKIRPFVYRLKAQTDPLEPPGANAR